MNDDRSPAERVARLRAEWHRYKAAEADAAAAAIRTADAVHKLGAALQAGADRDVAEHPDLAEMNVMLDGYYGPLHARG